MFKPIQKKIKYFLKSLIVLELFICFFTFVPVYAGEIVAIVNINNKVSILSLRDLRLIYQGSKKSWNGGEGITLFLPPPKSEAMKALASNVFNVDGPGAVAKFYLRAVYQEKFASPPKTSDNAVADVAATLGGIAIVDASEIGDNDSVKVVRVGGL